MNKDELIIYVKDEIKRGTKPSDIVSQLTLKGWTKEEIQEVFQLLNRDAPASLTYINVGRLVSSAITLLSHKAGSLSLLALIGILLWGASIFIIVIVSALISLIFKPYGLVPATGVLMVVMIVFSFISSIIHVWTPLAMMYVLLHSQETVSPLIALERTRTVIIRAWKMGLWFMAILYSVIVVIFLGILLGVSIARIPLLTSLSFFAPISWVFAYIVTFLLLSPLLLFIIWFSFASYILLEEQVKPLDALLKSKSYFRKHFVSRAALLSPLLVVVVFSVVPAILFPRHTTDIILSMGLFLLYVACGLFTMAYLACVYKEIRIVDVNPQLSSKREKLFFVVFSCVGSVTFCIILLIAGYFYIRTFFLFSPYSSPTKVTLPKIQQQGKSAMQQSDTLSQKGIDGIVNEQLAAFKTKRQTLFVLGGLQSSKAQSITRQIYYYNPDVGYWQQGPPMLTPRADFASAVYGTNIYVFGGMTGDTQDGTNSAEVFDPEMKSWTVLPPMKTERVAESAVTIDGKIYLVGGYRNGHKPAEVVDIFDPETKSWSTGSPSSDLVTYDTQVCGAMQKKIICPRSGHNTYTTVYDTEKDTWESLPTENRTNIWTGIGQSIQGKFYSLISMNGQHNTLSVYDAGVDSLSVSTPYHRQVYQFATASTDNFLMVMGGYPGSGPLDEAYAIDVQYPKIWFSLPSLPAPLMSEAAVSIPYLYGDDEPYMSSISGRITKKSLPQANIHVTLSAQGPSTDQHGTISQEFINTVGSVYTTEQGVYTFTSLRPGTYRVLVEQTGPQSGQFSVPMYHGIQQVTVGNNDTITSYNGEVQ